MSTGGKHFNEVFDRLGEEDRAELAVKPFLALYVKDAETDLENARERWGFVQDAARLRLRADGIEVQHRMSGSDGEMHTTALKPENDDPPEPVTVSLDDADWRDE